MWKKPSLFRQWGLLPQTVLIFAMGIGLCWLLPTNSTALAILSVFYFIFFSLLRKAIFFYLVVLCLGMWRMSLSIERQPTEIITKKENVKIIGTVIEPPFPQHWLSKNPNQLESELFYKNSWIILPEYIEIQHNCERIWPLKNTSIGKNFFHNYCFSKRSKKNTPLIKVSVYETCPNIILGDKIEIWGELTPIEGPKNPGESDIRFHFYSKGIYYCLVVRSNKDIQIREIGCTYTILDFFFYLRLRYIEILRESTNSETGNILAALLLGARILLTDKDMENFRNTGVYHLLAISGLHVSLVLCFVYFLLVKIRLPIFFCWIVMIFLALFYGLLVGMDTPVFRTVIMICLYFSGLYWGYTTHSIHTLSFAALVLLMIEPRELFLAGFQLTFLASLSIIKGYIPLSTTWAFFKFQHQYTSKYLYYFYCVWFYFKELTLVSVVVFLLTCPLIIFHFGYCNILAAFFSIFAIPIVTILLIGSILLLCSILGIGWGAKILGSILTYLADFLMLSIYTFSQWQIFICYWLPPLLLLMIVFYAMFIIFPLSLWNHYVRLFIIFFLIMQSGHLRCLKQAHAELIVLHVGHGCCVYIKLPTGEKILYDCGSQSKKIGQRVIIPFLQDRGITNLDAIILSHNDSDHYNGIFAISQSCKIFSIYANRSFILQSPWLRSLQRMNFKIIEVSNKQIFPSKDLEKSTLIFFNPGEKIQKHGIRWDNNHSLLLLGNLTEFRFLLTGDIADKSCEEFLQDYKIYQCKNQEFKIPISLLQIPHHGGQLYQTDELIKFLQPESVFINANDKFSRKEILQKYSNFGCKIYATWEYGALQWQWNY